MESKRYIFFVAQMSAAKCPKMYFSLMSFDNLLYKGNSLMEKDQVERK